MSSLETIPSSLEKLEKKEDKKVYRGERTSQEEFDSFFETLPEEQKELARREACLHKAYFAHLPESHPVWQEIRRVTDIILEKGGLQKDVLSLVVFESEDPDVCVQLGAKEVRISSSFLELVGGDLDKIVAVVAHEIGHVLLAHFKTPIVDNVVEDFDPLNEHIQGYEHEYQADRASVLLTNRLGIPPTKLSDALHAIESSLLEKSKKNKDYSRSDDQNHGLWILSTHPHTSKRTLAIERDADSLPHYPRILEQKQLAVPKKSEFVGGVDMRWGNGIKWDFRRKGIETDISGTGVSPDCLWEEVESPALVKARQEKKELYSILEETVPGIVLREEGDNEGDVLDSTPDEVNSWKLEDVGKAENWWIQAFQSLDSEDAYDDLSADIRSYSLESTLLLLKACRPEYELLWRHAVSSSSSTDPTYEGKDFDESGSKAHASRAILIKHTVADFTGELLIVSSLLVRNWFEKLPTLSTPEGFWEVPRFLRAFVEEHGTVFPYANGRFFHHLERFFKEAKTEEEREELLSQFREYEDELFAEDDDVIRSAQLVMPELWSALEARYLDEFPSQKKKASLKKYALPKEIEKAGDNETLSRQEARELLLKVPHNFVPTNSIRLLLSLKENTERAEIFEATYESTNEYALRMLSEAEYNEKYFGVGRKDYEKARYGRFEDKVNEYRDISILWKKSEYGAELAQMELGKERLIRLLSLYRAKSGERDVLINEALGFPPLVYVEDVLATREAIESISDVSLLFEMQDMYTNPLMELSVSHRLWNLYEKDAGAFFSNLPESERQWVENELEYIPAESQAERLKAILLAFRKPSFVRDDLLRPLVDAAEDEETTLLLAQWYAEPPPGVLSPRTSEMVAVTETLLDVIRGRDLLEKQELLLYFLGHRFFYTGIDKNLYIDVRKNERDLRQKALLMSPKEFRKLFKKPKQDEEKISYKTSSGMAYGVAPVERFNKNYLVESPDSLVFLQKTAGVPVEILLKQQQLATTRREQRDFLAQMLLGHDGILKEGNKEQFLSVVARVVTESSSWAKERGQEERQAMIDLLSFALSNCPEKRLPDLFLGIWNLQQEHESLPVITATMLRELGSLFIKAGQYLGTQSSSLPPEWIRAFRGLSDKNVRAEKTLLYEHEHALYGTESPFRKLGEKKGEGSMAAVYKGFLKDGNTEVAVKVVHSNIEQKLDEDAQFLEKLVLFINNRKSEFGVTLPGNLGEVSKNQVRRELSHEIVVQNNKDIRRVLQNSRSPFSWNVPEIYEDVTKPGFIVYEYSSGEAVDSQDPELRRQIEGELAVELLRQILVEGVYQADPNRGNFKVVVPSLKGEKIRIDWLDMDHTGRLTKEETKALRGLIGQVAFMKSTKKVSEALSSFVDGGEVDLVRDIEKWLVDSKVLSETSFENLEPLFNSFLDLLAEKKLVLKEHYVTLLRALGLMKPLLASAERSQFARLLPSLMR